MKNIAILLIIPLFAFLVFLSKYYFIDEEQKVYLALFEQYEDDEKTSSSVIFQSKPSDCDLINNVSRVKDIPVDIYQDFIKNNSINSSVNNLNSLSGMFHVVKYEYAKFFHETGSQAPEYKLKNKNIVKLSRVGFNSNKTESVICIVNSVNGNLVYLKKIKSEWVVFNTISLWVS